MDHGDVKTHLNVLNISINIPDVGTLSKLGRGVNKQRAPQRSQVLTLRLGRGVKQPRTIKVTGL